MVIKLNMFPNMIKFNNMVLPTGACQCPDLKSSRNLRPISAICMSKKLLLILRRLREAFQGCDHLRDNAKITKLSCLPRKNFALE